MKKNNKLIIALLSIFCVAFTLFAASCGAKKATLSFDTQGVVAVWSVEVEVGKEFTLPDVQKVGYELEGWYLSADFSGNAVTKVTPSANATYYAKLTKLTKVSLDFAGGNCSAENVLYVKKGAKVYDAVSGIVPVKTDAQFGAWYKGNAELSKNFTAGDEDVNLTAKYKVKWTAEIYVKDLDGANYTKRADDAVGYEYVTAAYTPDFVEEGLISVANANAVTTKDLSENASENKFKLYFDRKEYSLVYRASGENGAETWGDTLVYGEEKPVAVPFKAENKVIIGWSETPNGEILYATDFFGRDGVLVNGEDTSASTSKISVNKNTVLYAVWLEGRTAMLGGSDVIYLPDENGEKIYLERGGKYFVGTYDKDDKTFAFKKYNEVYERYETVVDGLIVSSSEYVYVNTSRAALVCIFCEYTATGYNKNESIKLLFDEYNGVKYQVTADGVTTQSTGTYTENGYVFTAEFTDGELAGVTKSFVVTYEQSSSGAILNYLFIERNDEQYNWGKLYRFGTFDNGGSIALGTTSNGVGTITLDGFATATYWSGSENVEYSYRLAGDILTLYDTSSGSLAGTFKIVVKDFDGTSFRGYVFYEEDEAHEYKFEDEKVSLKLDGGIDAVYTDENGSVEGYYLAEDGIFGSNVRFTSHDGKVNTLFILSSERVENIVSDGEGGTKTEYVTVYSLVEKNVGYVELYYSNEASRYYYPLLVLNDGEAGAATVYVYLKSKTYAKALAGTYAEVDGKYVFTATERFTLPENAFSEPIDLSKVASFVFSYEADSFALHYWYNYVDTDGDTVDFSDKAVEYAPANGGSATLKTFGGLLFYVEGNEQYMGTYATTDDGITTLTASDGSTLYFELDESAHTFVRLAFQPYNAYRRTADGETYSNVYIAFDGKGSAVWTELGEDKKVKTAISGTVTDTGRKSAVSVAAVYQFASSEKTFKFIYLYTSQNVYFAEYGGNDEDRYLVDGGDSGVLELDGYGFKAKWTDGEGTTYDDCGYVVDGETFVVSVGEGVRYFDKKNGEISLRGLEYGTYLYVENNMPVGYIFELDGYGLLKVYKSVLKTDGEGAPELDADGNYVYEKVYLDENGAYALASDGESFDYSFVSGASTEKGNGKLGTYVDGSYSYRSFITVCRDVVTTYVVTDDWSVVVLDDIGNATVYDKNGAVETGRYTIVTDEFIYYYNTSATDSCIYKYDAQNALLTKVKYTNQAFYTSTLESLLFSSHGFAIFGGSETYYYSVDDNDDVIIYKPASDDELDQANEYGFVSKKFGNLSEFESGRSKDYEGKTYYYSDGWAISFDRAEATATKYPVEVSTKIFLPLGNLKFTPSGASEFYVSGSVEIGASTYACYIGRELIEGTENYRTYVKVGSYEFAVNLTYTGAEINEYEVTALTSKVSYYAYNYFDLYYTIYIYFGSSAAASLPNSFGTVEMNATYDEDGALVSQLLTATLGSSSGIVDINGENITSVKDAPYKTENNLISFEVATTDGFKYRMYIGLASHNAFSMSGYRIYAFTRVQTLTSGDYEVEVERVVYSDFSSSLPGGSIFSLALYKVEGENKTLVEFEQAGTINGVYTGITRTKDGDNHYTTATYYKVAFIENDDAYVKENETTGSKVTGVASYASVTVTVINAQTVYGADGYDTFVDINDDNVIELYYYGSQYYAVTSCSYDADTQTWTMEAGIYTYTVKVVDGRAVITKIETEEV